MISYAVEIEAPLSRNRRMMMCKSGSYNPFDLGSIRLGDLPVENEMSTMFELNTNPPSFVDCWSECRVAVCNSVSNDDELWKIFEQLSFKQ